MATERFYDERDFEDGHGEYDTDDDYDEFDTGPDVLDIGQAGIHARPLYVSPLETTRKEKGMESDWRDAQSATMPFPREDRVMHSLVAPRRMLRSGSGVPRPAVWRDEAEREAWLDACVASRHGSGRGTIEVASLDDL
jgi:hypothetical protein